MVSHPPGHCDGLMEMYFPRQLPRTADLSERGVPAFHPEAAGVQVLVLGDQGHRNCLLLHLLSTVQHPGLLANPRHVLHHPLLYHYEEADQGMFHYPVLLDNLGPCVSFDPPLPQHMIRFRYIPFTWGKPKFQVRCSLSGRNVSCNCLIFS